MGKQTHKTHIYCDLDAIHHHGLDINSRELYVLGEPDSSASEDGGEPGVEFLMANRLIKNLRILTNLGSEPILIHMKTCGGCWEEGMAIYDAIHNCPCFVTILNYTHARSMSSIILQAADKRVMMPHSYFMFHHGVLANAGHYTEVLSQVEQAKRGKNVMLDIYVEVLRDTNTPMWRGLSPKQIKAKLERHMSKELDVYLSAEEAVEWGFADVVFDGAWENLARL